MDFIPHFCGPIHAAIKDNPWKYKLFRSPIYAYRHSGIKMKLMFPIVKVQVDHRYLNWSTNYTVFDIQHNRYW